MKKMILASASLLASFGAAHQAHAQKGAMGMFYEMQLAPSVCKWTDAADHKKLDVSIAAQEKGLGVSASEKATMVKTAEAELKSDPSNCDKDGMLRMMYNEAVK
jgi:hypothetical protein